MSSRQRPNLKLLAKVANVVELIPPEHFDMGEWLRTQELSPTSEFCKTVGCAIGKACELGVFPGVVPVIQVLEASAMSTGRAATVVRFDMDGNFGTIHQAVFAAEQQLGLRDEDFAYLFTSSSVMSKTPRQVANRIRKFIRDYPQSSRVAK